MSVFATVAVAAVAAQKIKERKENTMRKAGTAWMMEDGTLVVYFDATEDYHLSGTIALIDENSGGASSGTMDLDDTIPDGVPTRAEEAEARANRK